MIVSSKGSYPTVNNKFISVENSANGIVKVGDNVVLLNGKCLKIRYTPDIPLSSFEQELKTNAVSELQRLNQNRKFVSFGFITDLHESYQDVKYGGANAVVSAENSIKLLGSIANDFGLSAVICGGDLSTGGDITFEQYDTQMQVVKSMFDRYVAVPKIFVNGNHDYHYNDSVTVRTNQQMHQFMESFNTGGDCVDLTYLTDTNTEYIGNDVCLDFPQQKVRMLLCSNFTERSGVCANSTWPGYMYPLVQCMDFDGLNPDEWTVGVIAHYVNSTGYNHAAFLNNYLQGTWRGAGSVTQQVKVNPNEKQIKATFGCIMGHLHQTKREYDANYNSPIIWVSNAFTRRGNANTNDDYCFSIFTVDTDNWTLYETAVGRETDGSGVKTYSYNMPHND